MALLGVILSLALIVLLLVDGFEAMVLPRRVTRPYRLARVYYRLAWAAWRAVGCRLRPGRWREAFLGVFGPLSILGLFATWVCGLIIGFALLHGSLGTAVQTPGGPPDLGTYLYLSGTTFFTLGYGDVVPLHGVGRFLAAAEAGMGFGFMAVIIGYLPVLYAAFSRREVTISLLDGRGGSPPSAAQVVLRLAQARDPAAAARPLLAEWERWSAELLESHLSFPVLSYYRSQHDNQSWVATLTAILDVCALLLADLKDADRYQAQMTFAMARHAAVDLALMFRTPPLPPEADRLPSAHWDGLRGQLLAAGLRVRDGEAVGARLGELRETYEPFVNALARHLLFTLPPFVPEQPPVDNWQRTAWARRAPGIGQLPLGDEFLD
jgi:hypothetical protein